MKVNAGLHAKLDGQIRDSRAANGRDPTSLYLTHDEIDEWRNQFALTIPVSILAYKSIPIRERD